jgi:hypothetical protein
MGTGCTARKELPGSSDMQQRHSKMYSEEENLPERLWLFVISRGSGLVNSGRAAGAVDGWKRCEALGRRKLGWNGPDYSSEAGCMRNGHAQVTVDPCVCKLRRL